MNGPHDMGGMQCYGPVHPEPNEPVFHENWEKRALAMTVAMGAIGRWNLDMSRHARESLDPAFYLSSSYYEIWIAALENLLIEHELAEPAEIADGQLRAAPLSVKSVPDQRRMAEALSLGAEMARPVAREPAFSAGQAIRTKNHQPETHTRLPAYARNRDGVIDTVIGYHVFPDSNASGRGEDPHWLYTVRFDASELFGGGAQHTVFVDCWEPYLEPR